MRALSLPLTGLLLLTACSAPAAPNDQEAVSRAITEANHCETKEDCVLVGSKCPFDCYIYAHKDEADRIRSMVDAYPSDCTYSCIASEGVDCIANVCVSIPEGAGSVLEGNTGESCTSHDDCVTPLDYLVRSSCPFVSMCVDGKCAVTCPARHDNIPGGGIACQADIDCTCDGNAAGVGADCRCIDGQCAGVVKES